MKKYPWLVPVVILASCLGVLALWLARLEPPNDSTIVTAPQRRDFTMTDTAGQTVSLATYQGKWLLLFFGFTNCPDACPTAMLNVGATLRELGSAAANLQPIFVTIDPERDTPALMKEYLANFGDSIIGLSGTPENTFAVASAYGVYYKKRALANNDYTMDHSTAFYLVSPQGEFVRPYKPDLDPAAFAKDLTAAMTTQKENPR